MAFKKVADLNTDTVVSLGGVNKKTGKKNPTQIEGYYLGFREVDDRKKKSGKSYIYVFQTSKGDVGVWGKTDLDAKMKTVGLGTMTRVTSTGTRPTPNGDMYTYLVEIDEDNSIEVSGALSAAPAAADDEDDGAGYEEAEEYSSEDADSEEAAQEAALAAAEARKAKVQALLNKAKNASK